MRDLTMNFDITTTLIIQNPSIIHHHVKITKKINIAWSFS